MTLVCRVAFSELSTLLQGPTQPNFCDCGLFLLHFVRCFLATPEPFTKTIYVRTLARAGQLSI